MGPPLFAGELGKHLQQDLRPVLAVALGLGHAVDLFGQRKAGQYQAHALAFFQAETQVLDEMVHEETGCVVASQQTAAQGTHGHTARTQRAWIRKH